MWTYGRVVHVDLQPCCVLCLIGRTLDVLFQKYAIWVTNTIFILFVFRVKLLNSAQFKKEHRRLK